MFSTLGGFQLDCCFYSSFTIALVAFLTRHSKSMLWLSKQSAILFSTSLSYYVFKNRYVLYIDKAIVHLLALQLFWRGTVLTNQILSLQFSNQLLLGLFWISFLYSFFVYYIVKKSHLPGTDWIPWHVSVHCVGSFGCIILNLASENHEKQS